MIHESTEWHSHRWCDTRFVDSPDRSEDELQIRANNVIG